MAREFITELGGPKATAQSLCDLGHDVGEKAVSAWGVRGVIPWKWRGPLAELARRQSVAKEHIPEEVLPFLKMKQSPQPHALGGQHA